MKTKRYHWFARDNEILLDLDTPEAIEQFKYNVKYSLEVHKVVTLDSVTSEHKHVFITLKRKLEGNSRINMSIELGSDPKRASADRARLAAGATDFQCLIRFDKPSSIRKPDLVCLCPMMWKGERLRACVHLRNYEPHCYWSGTKSTKTAKERASYE